MTPDSTTEPQDGIPLVGSTEEVHLSGAEQPPVKVGFSTILGLLVTLAAMATAFVAAIQANDLGAAAGLLAGALTAAKTIDSRGKQAIALIDSAAEAALPFVQALSRLDDPEADEVPDGDLPSDAQEHAAPPPPIA